MKAKIHPVSEHK